MFKSADQAGRLAADAEALAHYRQAMAASTAGLRRPLDPLQRAALERKMGEAFFRRGEHAQALERFQRPLACLGHTLPMARWGIAGPSPARAVWQAVHHLLPRLFVKPPGGPVSAEVEEQYRRFSHHELDNTVADQERYLLSSLMMVNSSERTG